MDIFEYNRDAWDAESARGSEWTVPVDAAMIARARAGDWSIVLTPQIPVPRAWFPPSLTAVRVLGLAAGGGQQMPILAAAGATVTLLDASPRQLATDAAVAEREGLSIRREQGDMADLSRFADASFDLIVHPCSNLFVPDIEPVWRECHRVLRPGGELLSGFAQPVWFLFSEPAQERGELVVANVLPFDERYDLDEGQRQTYIDKREPLVFGHTFDAQLGGQLRAGFVLVDLYEDRHPGVPLSEYIANYMATRARKP
jgi:SAM-dependent methyltransferase